MLQNDETQKKTCLLARLSVFLFIASIVAFIIANLLDKEIMAFIAFGLLAASPVLGVVALIKIYRSGGILKGKSATLAVIIISTIFLYLFAPRAAVTMSSNLRPGTGMICGSNLSGLGKAILVYSNDWDDKIPDSNWCDLLITMADVSPKQLICKGSDAIQGESSYALNKEAVGKKTSEIPADLVLLFETNYGQTKSGRDFPIKQRECFSTLTNFKIRGNKKVYKDRWNQVGGPELLTIDNHTEGCFVLLADGRPSFIKTANLQDLRWKIEGKPDFPLPVLTSAKQQKDSEPFRKTAVWIIGIVIAVIWCFILYKYRFTKFWLFSILLGIASAGVGYFFGAYSNELYRHIGINKFYGAETGAILGFIVGTCYAVIIAQTSEKIKNTGYAVATGMATGAICSTLLHIILMVIYGKPVLLYIIAGLPYGIIAGAILGTLSAGIVYTYYQKEQNE